MPTPLPSDRSPAAVLSALDMPLRGAMETQRAVRRVHFEPVDDEIVLRCIELALKAPTGSNAQNWEFVVVKDRDKKSQFAAMYRQAWAVYSRAGRDRRSEEMERIARSVAWQVEHFADIPVVVVPCVRGGRIPFVPLPAIVESSYYGSIYPSVQNLLLAARAVGLGASLITLPLWNPLVARRTLGLPLTVQPVCMVPMGWARGSYGPARRKPVGSVVHVDTFGNRPWA